MNITFWLALIPVLSALGTFIDTYHFRDKTRAALQLALIALYVKFEALPKRLASLISPKLARVGEMIYTVIFWLLFLAGYSWGLSQILELNREASVIETEKFEMHVIVLGPVVVGFAFAIGCVLVFMIPVWIVYGLCYAFHRLGLQMIDAASRPAVSPLGYIGALIGLIGTIIEVAQKLATHGGS